VLAEAHCVALLHEDGAGVDVEAEVVLDPTYGSVEITFHGEYSFKVVDPVVLVGNILGANAKDIVKVSDIIGQLKLQFTSNVSTCISNIMVNNNISFNVVQKYKQEVAKEMNDLLDESWKQQYGIEVQDVSLVIGASDETMARIREYSDLKSKGDLYSQNTAGMMAAASAEALKSAASNTNGAMMGFAGMNLATNAGAGLMGAANQNVQAQAAPAAPQAGVVAATGGAVPNFCPNCGTPTNGANFCGNCGTKLA
jgi:membrane protease subunit (stomatin/prohibitin family)